MTTVYMRPAIKTDLKEITTIIDGARHFLKAQGLPQWQSGYPNEETVATDIALNRGYVLVVGSKVAGYTALIAGADPVYEAITEGQWVSDTDEYISVHRFAISDGFRGQKLAQRFMTAILTLCYDKNQFDVRIDTHPENHPMQSVITGNGFEKRGTIFINEGKEINGERWAYQLILA
ncbi:MAG: GNAT family N-acetyltransferase [Leuconostoc pseudomesenteroides]|jgi:GNAT superfamily N-acetyltransferase|uniref:GNAT family N-acetyltransferase n=1 Tax=Leuconostoc pseudomesenteroides TaxID=33968 RepID=UPI00166DFAAB|nr:GNAT family N-acetyltransferase [Leuconostoc pseudomesenteroides]MBS0957605.1 GNAT family N-acetyltransferase [Leuconostoc pseudomesenteroides]MCC7668783.1 GNAT family N-acetyltransferase [Leuconostoc pseudomesenteroides]MCT4413039.1 GNAT family N-acetyltransferase [Leuconostoc pseudomesenteroides]WAM37923.1 GNAT family N-acetyltransferase [Leuconostoc pseudomesenteroides]